MVDGEARIYMRADYEPHFPVPFEKLKTTDHNDATITRVRQERTDTTQHGRGFRGRERQ